MKLKDNALSPENPESAPLRRMIRSSQMGCVVLDCLSSETTEEAIVELLRALFDVPADTVRTDVTHILATLRELNALDE